MFCLLGIVGIFPKRFGQGRLGAERERHGRHGLCKWRFFVEGMLGMFIPAKDLYRDELPCSGLDFKSPSLRVFNSLVGEEM